MTCLHLISIVSFSLYKGLNALVLGSIVCVHFLKIIEDTLPSLSLIISLGPQAFKISIPSSRVSSISSLDAGITSLSSKESIVTLPEVNLLAVLAASTATLPPPTTTQSESHFVVLSSVASCKKSTAVITPFASSPAIPGRLPP